MDQLFLGAFPDMKTVYREKDNAALIDFVDPDRMVLINRRGLFSYDVLIQPDILKIFRLLDPKCTLHPVVDLSRIDAEDCADEIRAEIRRRMPSLRNCETRDDIQPYATRIIWGTYSMFVVSKRAGITAREPYYVAVRRSITQ